MTSMVCWLLVTDTDIHIRFKRAQEEKTGNCDERGHT
jgi:hypothetical protein